MQKDMRYYINLIESAQAEAELLDEGPIGKALATAALALGLQFGQQANAEEVYVYQDAQGELKSVSSYMQVPDDTPLSYVIDTDTKQIKYLKQPDTSKVKVPAQSDKGGKELYGGLTSGMTIEQVMEVYPDGKQVNGVGGALGVGSWITQSGMGNKDNVKYMLKRAPLDNKGKTFFEFNKNNQLVGVYFVYGMTKPFKSAQKGQGFGGFDKNEVPDVMSKVKDILPADMIGSISGSLEIHKGGEFGMNIGVSKLAKVGGDIGGVGLGIPMDKVGTAWSSVETSKGQFSMIWQTQSGMINSFRPGGIIVGIKDQGLVSNQDISFN